METGNIYLENVNMNESIDDFLAAQEDQTKKVLAYKISLTINLKDNNLFKRDCPPCH